MQCSKAYKNGTIYDVVIASETNSSTRVEHKIVDAVIGPSNYIRCICFLLKTLLFLNRKYICCNWHWLKDRALSMKQGTKNVMLASVQLSLSFYFANQKSQFARFENIPQHACIISVLHCYD